ncbi:hypothetical protein ACJX0J_024157, partial [Zea mays]
GCPILKEQDHYLLWYLEVVKEKKVVDGVGFRGQKTGTENEHYNIHNNANIHMKQESSFYLVFQKKLHFSGMDFFSFWFFYFVLFWLNLYKTITPLKTIKLEPIKIIDVAEANIGELKPLVFTFLILLLDKEEIS